MSLVRSSSLKKRVRSLKMLAHIAGVLWFGGQNFFDIAIDQFGESVFAFWLLISKDASLDGRFGIALPFHGQSFGGKRLNKNWMSFDSNAGAVGNRPVLVDGFVDAFHSFSLGFNFQRLAAGLIANCCRRVVHKWSTELNRTLG